jgi:hypothetical protein
LACGPTRTGTINPAFAASTAAESEGASQGCTTAVKAGFSPAQRAMIRAWRAGELDVSVICHPRYCATQITSLRR